MLSRIATGDVHYITVRPFISDELSPLQKNRLQLPRTPQFTGSDGSTCSSVLHHTLIQQSGTPTQQCKMARASRDRNVWIPKMPDADRGDRRRRRSDGSVVGTGIWPSVRGSRELWNLTCIRMAISGSPGHLALLCRSSALLDQSVMQYGGAG